MIKTLLVPGLDGSVAPHWQQWWAATDSHALMVGLSDPSHPDPARWQAELAGTILRHPGARCWSAIASALITRVLTTWSQLNVRAAVPPAPIPPQR